MSRTRLHALFALFSILIFAGRHVDAANAATATNAAAASSSVGGPCTSTRITSRDGLIWTDVTSGGHHFHFVLDSGAAQSCVDLQTMRRLGLHPLGHVQVAGVDGMGCGLRCSGFVATVGAMRLPGTVLAIDLSRASRGCSQRIDGLVGADFFLGHVVRLDFSAGILTRDGIARIPDNARSAPLRIASGILCAPVSVNGGPVEWTRVDTGCVRALDWCGHAGIASPSRKSVALSSSSGSGMQAALTVGPFHIAGIPVQLRGHQLFPGEAGLLGVGTLSRFRVTMDCVHARLILDRK